MGLHPCDIVCHDTTCHDTPMYNLTQASTFWEMV
jgi:hypothetical protein